MTLSLAATVAAPTPSVGAVRVKTRFAVPENTAPQSATLGVAARVSVFSVPVVAPWVNVTELITLLVKSKSAGKVMMIVSVDSAAPVGVVNLIVWLDVVLTFELDIVSDLAVKAAACATCKDGPTKIAIRARITPKLIIVFIFFILNCL